jgi:dTDP-4-amino-4,6-dideoxygalactose transaminase
VKVPFFDLGVFVREQKSEVMAAIERVVDSGTYIGGDEVANFESAFAKSVGAKHCVGVGNGLDAIRLLLEAHDIGPGDEVIVPGFTFYATWLAVLQVGAIPVAVDVRLSDASIDPEKIGAAITPATKAIIVVHLFGISANMLEINKIAKTNSLLVFEDCAQAHNGQTNAGPVGNSSDGAAFSFYPTKNLGALGDAGAITLNDSGILQKLRSRRSYGVGSNKYEHVDTGWNTRLDPLQAAILSTFLPGLKSVTEERRATAQKYTSVVEDPANNLIRALSPEENVFHHFVVRAKSRSDFQKAMLDQDVMTDIHYPYFFNSLEPIRAKYNQIGKVLPNIQNSKTLADGVVSLPIGPWMTDEQVDKVSKSLSNLNL